MSDLMWETKIPGELKPLVPPELLKRRVLDEDTIETCVARGMMKTPGYKTLDDDFFTATFHRGNPPASEILKPETRQWLGNLLIGLEEQEPHHPLLTEYAREVTGLRRSTIPTKEEIEQRLPAQGDKEQTRAFRIIKALADHGVFVPKQPR